MIYIAPITNCAYNFADEIKAARSPRNKGSQIGVSFVRETGGRSGVQINKSLAVLGVYAGLNESQIDAYGDLAVVPDENAEATPKRFPI